MFDISTVRFVVLTSCGVRRLCPNTNGCSDERLDKVIRKEKVINLDSSNAGWRPHFLTNFRSSIMVATCISILAGLPCVSAVWPLTLAQV